MIQSVFIVAGHGLGTRGQNDNGASANGVIERDQVTEIAAQLEVLLRGDRDLEGMRVVPVGVEERMKLTEKIGYVNALCSQQGWTKRTSLLVSLHINAAGNTQVRGLEAWYGDNEDSADFALDLVQETHKESRMPLRPYPTRPSSRNRWGRLGIIDDTTPKACLMELGFLTNPQDAAFLKSSRRDDLAVGLYKGIRKSVSLGPDTRPLPRDFFTDVPSDAWYRDSVMLGLQEGLFQMSPDGKFHPDRPITRAELAAVMARHIAKHHRS